MPFGSYMELIGTVRLLQDTSPLRNSREYEQFIITEVQLVPYGRKNYLCKLNLVRNKARARRRATSTFSFKTVINFDTDVLLSKQA